MNIQYRKSRPGSTSKTIPTWITQQSNAEEEDKIMEADNQPSVIPRKRKRVTNPRHNVLSASERKRRYNQNQRVQKAKVVSIGKQVNRWNELKESLGLTNHSLAELLLDTYETTKSYSTSTTTKMLHTEHEAVPLYHMYLFLFQAELLPKKSPSQVPQGYILQLQQPPRTYFTWATQHLECQKYLQLNLRVKASCLVLRKFLPQTVKMRLAQSRGGKTFGQGATRVTGLPTVWTFL